MSKVFTILYNIVRTKRENVICEPTSTLSLISLVIENNIVAIRTLIMYEDFLQNFIGSALMIPTNIPKITTNVGIIQ